MIDAVIDEHFRRSLGSLGPDYMNLKFGKRFNQLKSPSSVSPPLPNARKAAEISPIQVNSPESSTRKFTTPSSTPSPSSSPHRPNENSSNQTTPKVAASSTLEKGTPANGSCEAVEISVDDHFAKALGDTWKQLQQHNKSNASSGGSDNENDTETNATNNSTAKDDEDDDDDDRPMLEVDTPNHTES